MKSLSILITGTNRGIGHQLVKGLLSRLTSSDHVFATCRSTAQNELEKLRSQLLHGEPKANVHVFSLDVAQDDSIAKAVDYVRSVVGENGLNVLINNAGIMNNNRSKLGRIERNNLTEHLNTNTFGPLLLAQAMLPLLKKAASHTGVDKRLKFDRAAVINISSVLGSIGSGFGTSYCGYGYAISKTALNMATKALALEIRNDSILVVSVCPGWVRTDLGGPNASQSVENCVEKLLLTFDQLSELHHGLFIDVNGRTLPW